MIAIRALVALSMGLPLVLLTGCETGTGVGPPGKSPVATKIEFASRYHIEKAIMTVFLAEGFQTIGQLPGRTLFERAGDSTLQANYGDWFGEGTLVRAEVVLTEVEFGTHLVTCNVSMQEGGRELFPRDRLSNVQGMASNSTVGGEGIREREA